MLIVSCELWAKFAIYDCLFVVSSPCTQLGASVTPGHMVGGESILAYRSASKAQICPLLLFYKLLKYAFVK